MKEPRFQSHDEALTLHPYVRARCLEYKNGAAAAGRDAAQHILSLAEEYEELLRLPNPMLPIRGTSAQIMAAVCLVFQRWGGTARPFKALTFFIGEDSAASRAKAMSLKAEWGEWRRLAVATAETPLMTALPSMGAGADGYSWIRDSVSAQCRVERLAGAFASLRYSNKCASGTKELVAGTRMVSMAVGQAAVTRPPLGTTQTCRIWSGKGRTLMDEAEKQARGGRKVVAALPVSQHERVGGALLEGGCPGAEEDACIRSNLYSSLAAFGGRDSSTLAGGRKGAKGAPLTDGILVSPGVEVFRGSAREGYPWLGAPARLEAVMSFTAPSSGSEGGNGDLAKLQEALLLQKFEVLVSEAARLRARCLVVSAGFGKTAVVRRALQAAIISVSNDIEDAVLTD
jgi:hypothetical protein